MRWHFNIYMQDQHIMCKKYLLYLSAFYFYGQLNFMRSWVEHEKRFITLEPGVLHHWWNVQGMKHVYILHTCFIFCMVPASLKGLLQKIVQNTLIVRTYLPFNTTVGLDTNTFNNELTIVLIEMYMVVLFFAITLSENETRVKWHKFMYISRGWTSLNYCVNNKENHIWTFWKYKDG